MLLYLRYYQQRSSSGVSELSSSGYLYLFSCAVVGFLCVFCGCPCVFARPLSAALVCMDHPAALVCACVVYVVAPRCHGVCFCSLTAISVCVCLLLAVCVCCLPTALVCACVVHVLYTGCVCSISISLSPPSAVSYDAKGIFPPGFRTKYLAFLPSNGT